MFWAIRLKWLVLCFHRWQPERRWEWGDGHRRCLALAASARADSPPSGASTLPQRKKQKLILVSTRSECSFRYQSDLQNRLAAKISFFLSLSGIDCVQFFFFAHWAFSLCVPAGLCWWRRASEKASKWHICWSCQGTHSKYEYFAVGINLIQTRGSQEWVGSARTPASCKPPRILSMQPSRNPAVITATYSSTLEYFSFFFHSICSHMPLLHCGRVDRQGGVPLAVWFKTYLCN